MKEKNLTGETDIIKVVYQLFTKLIWWLKDQNSHYIYNNYRIYNLKNVKYDIKYTKCRDLVKMYFRMCLKLSVHQYIIDIQKNKKKGMNITLRKLSNHKGKEQQKKGAEKNYKNNQKIMNKMTIRTYPLSIILNVNEINASITRYRL